MRGRADESIGSRLGERRFSMSRNAKNRVIRRLRDHAECRGFFCETDRKMGRAFGGWNPSFDARSGLFAQAVSCFAIEAVEASARSKAFAATIDAFLLDACRKTRAESRTRRRTRARAQGARGRRPDLGFGWAQAKKCASCRATRILSACADIRLSVWSLSPRIRSGTASRAVCRAFRAFLRMRSDFISSSHPNPSLSRRSQIRSVFFLRCASPRPSSASSRRFRIRSASSRRNARIRFDPARER